MSVLVEGISVIVRREAIEKKFQGGIETFKKAVPNNTFCADKHLVRVGFMSPQDVESFVKFLESHHLIFVYQQKPIDMVVVDQLRGPTIVADCLEFSHVRLGDSGNSVAACWLRENPLNIAGITFSSYNNEFAVPEGWNYENSLSSNFTFSPNGKMEERLKLLRVDNNIEVYLDPSTGKEVYIGRIGRLKQ